MIRKNFLVACIAAVAIHEVAANSLTQRKEKTDEDANSHGHGKGKGQSPALIQTFIQSSNHTCLYAQNRNKAALPDFNAIEKGTQLYVDPDFTPDRSSLFWADRGEGELQSYANMIIWKRAGEYYKDHSLFGTNGIGPDDIDQGSLGNCWFLSAAAALAEFPGRLEKIFQNSGSELNANGIYAMNFYTLGVPHTVIIDDYLPLREWGPDFNTIFASVGKDKSLWGPLLEKAFAKYHGNYEHIQGGDERRSIRTMSNAPSETAYHKHSGLTQQDLDNHWDLLQSTDAAAGIMQTSGASGSGLTDGHAYTLLGVATLSNGQKLVKIRNPWGTEKYGGRWSRYSDLWTDTLRAEVAEDLANDGIFFMAHKDFYFQFRETVITHNTEGWHSSHFLMLDDTTSVAGSYSTCGATCTRHNMKLTSDVDQTVFLTAQTWDQRCLGRDCKNIPRRSSLIRVMGHHFSSFRDQIQLPSFEMKAGETLSVETEWDWTSPDIAHDWSAVAWGNKGPITITHNEGLESMSLPVIYGIDKTPYVNPPTSQGNTTTTTTTTTTPVATTTTPVESKFGKTLRESVNDWDNNWADWVCKDTIWYTMLDDNADGEKELFQMKNDCPDTLMTLKVWMDTDEWNGVEFYKNFDAQGNELVHTTPTKCNVDAADARLTVCEWLVGDPKLGGVFRMGYVQTQGDNKGYAYSRRGYTIGGRVAK